MDNYKVEHMILFLPIFKSPFHLQSSRSMNIFWCSALSVKCLFTVFIFGGINILDFSNNLLVWIFKLNKDKEFTTGARHSLHHSVWRGKKKSTTQYLKIFHNVKEIHITLKYNVWKTRLQEVEGRHILHKHFSWHYQWWIRTENRGLLQVANPYLH